MGKYKIQIHKFPGYDRVDVYVYSRDGTKTTNYSIRDDGGIEGEQVPEMVEYKEIKPFMSIPGMMWEEFVLALTEQLPDISKREIDAELKSTKYHLEDMRSLVFEKQTTTKEREE